MGSATVQSLATVDAALAAASGVDLDVADELFAAARALADTSQLSGALADQGASKTARAKIAADVFAPLRPVTRDVLATVAVQRWSTADDLIDAVEELAIRAAAIAAPDVDIEGELFAFGRTISRDPQLELALGSRLGDAGAKGRLVWQLLTGRASEAATLVASAVVQRPRERRVRELLARAQRLTAAQRGDTVATVTTAVPLSAAQRDRLAVWLSTKYTSAISVNTVVDPTLIGGLRVKVADDVIDATIASRLADLRQRLAG